MIAATDERIPALTLGWRLKMALADSGLGVEDMAEHLGMSRQTLSRWMNDQGAPPRPVYVREWAALTGVSLAWLQTGDPSGGGGPAVPMKRRGRRGDSGAHPAGLPRLDSNQQPSGYQFHEVAA